MNIMTISKESYMTNDFYSTQPMEMAQLNLNMIIDKNPNFMNALHRSVNHPSIQKFSNTPFNIH